MVHRTQIGVEKREGDLMGGGFGAGNLVLLQHEVKGAAADAQALGRQFFIPAAFF